MHSYCVHAGITVHFPCKFPLEGSGGKVCQNPSLRKVEDFDCYFEFQKFTNLTCSHTSVCKCNKSKNSTIIKIFSSLDKSQRRFALGMVMKDEIAKGKRSIV